MEILDESKQEFINILRTKIKENKRILNIQTDEKYLLRFLYSTDFDVDDALDRMLYYHENIVEIPDWFTRCSPLEKKHHIDQDMCMILPCCDKEARPIYIFKMENIPADKMTFLELTALDDIWYEYILSKNPAVAAKGLCVIIDVKNFSWGLLRWAKPYTIKKMIKKYDYIPFSEMSVHIINSSTLFNLTMKIIWPFIPEGSKSMFHLHFNDLNTLYNYIDRSELPSEYGGSKIINYEEIYKDLYDRNEEISRNFKLYRNVKKK